MTGQTNDDVRVIVTTLDAVTQADLWLTLGPDEATEVFVAVVRTALLLSGQIVIDRNQLLDGVCFLALGPEGLARALGLEAGAALPLLVNCQPAPDAPADVPRLLGRQTGFERHPTLWGVSLAHQVTWVRTPAFRSASSAMAALGLRPEGRDWLYPEGDRSRGWFPGAGFTDLLHELTDPTEVIARVEHAQDAWIAAMATGRVSADLWGGDMDMPSALQTQREALAAACGGEVEPHPLALHVLGETSPTRKDALVAIEAWAQAHPEQANARSMRLAITLWSRAYYRAIASKDDAMLLAINVDAATDAHARPTEARRFGLAMPVRSPWRRWWDRQVGRSRASRGGLRVDGEILDTMRQVHPVAFRQLSDGLDRVSGSGHRISSSTGMHDVALAARDAVPQVTSYREQRRSNRIRMIIGTLLAVTITWLSLVADVSDLSDGAKAAAVIAAAAIGLVASLPWDALAGELRTRPSAMTAMLDVRGDQR